MCCLTCFRLERNGKLDFNFSVFLSFVNSRSRINVDLHWLMESLEILLDEIPALCLNWLVSYCHCYLRFHVTAGESSNFFVVFCLNFTYFLRPVDLRKKKRNNINIVEHKETMLIPDRLILYWLGFGKMTVDDFSL